MEKVIDVVSAFICSLTLLKVFVSLCISAVPCIAFVAGLQKAKKDSVAELAMGIGATVSISFAGIAFLICFFWGIVDILLLVGVPGEWIGLAAIVFVLFGFANAFDHMH